MQLPDFADSQLSYCLNVHPGATLEEMRHAAFDLAPEVFAQLRELTGREGPYGLGLWPSAASAAALRPPEATASFRQELEDAGLYAFTFNGFPYGKFHDQRVKERVYRPDWTEDKRRAYTLDLAHILAGLLPEGGEGSISSVPVTYNAWATPAVIEQAVEQLMATVAGLHHIEAETGRTIRLALEPEPDCYLENLGTIRKFFEADLQGHGLHVLANALGHDAGDAELILRQHLGICLDLIHVAVAFEDSADTMRALKSARIPVWKVQIGAALASREPGLAPAGLAAFGDDIYFHQTRCRTAEELRRWPDLPEALADDAEGDWRVHYHVPLVWEGDDQLVSTRDAVTPGFFRAARDHGVRHYEVETYTLGLFPDKDAPDAEILARELAWVIERIAQASS